VERNALRAGLVERAEDWRWSSLWRWRHPEAMDNVPPEERLRGLSPEEVVSALSEDDAVRVREILNRKQTE
jgi:hypothetical protein